MYIGLPKMREQKKLRYVQKCDSFMFYLKGYGHEFGQILFLCFYYLQSFKDAFLMI